MYAFWQRFGHKMSYFYAFMWVVMCVEIFEHTGRSLAEMFANPHSAPPYEVDKYKKWLQNHGMTEDMNIAKR